MIITIVRTKNEENNIEKFCRSYMESGLSDAVFVADGGSDDDTIAIAESIPGVEVREYSGQIFGEEGDYWRNPHGEQINFMIDWAEEAGADWIIFDDCDCTPNELLKAGGRCLIEANQLDFVYAVRIYFWGENEWFPNLSINKKVGPEAWMYSLYGWRAGIDWRASEKDPWRHEFTHTISEDQYLKIAPPLALLHHAWPTEEDADKKLDFYRTIGQHPTMLHPTEFGGPREPILEWMK